MKVIMTAIIVLVSTAAQAFGQADVLPPLKFDKPFRGKLEIDRVKTEDDVRGKCQALLFSRRPRAWLRRAGRQHLLYRAGV